MQISLFEAEITYGSLFEGQELNLWNIDNEFLLNCNYKGTMQYIDTFLQSGKEIVLSGATLQPGRDNSLTETYWMTSVGNNDRGTFIVPDHIAMSLMKDANILLVQYKPGTNAQVS